MLMYKTNKMTLLRYLWGVFVFVRLCAGYNVEVTKVGVANGTSGSQFGYTVIFSNEMGWNPIDGGNALPNQWLLAGAPNLEVNGIKAHGDVYKCTQPRDERISCIRMNIKDVSETCKYLRSTQDRPHCEEDSRMGATLQLNPHYDTIVKTKPRSTLVTACAPGWKHVLKEEHKYMTGMCLHMNSTYQPLDCRSNRGKCFPYWPSNIVGQKAIENGLPVFAYAVGGLSAAYTHDGSSQVIGAPGVNRNRGSFRVVQPDMLVKIDFQASQSTTYYGYAIATGSFGNKATIAVGQPNFHTTAFGYVGRVEMRHNDDQIDMQFNFPHGWQTCKFTGSSYDEFVRENKVKKQVGSKFGATLAAIDITGDGVNELFVGAPLYSDEMIDEGRVFVFDTTNNCLLGILSGGAKVAALEEQASFGRFGTSIANAGDLDRDGSNDVAIGAPYENGDSGAVYIYSGIGDCQCYMTNTISQRIVGKELDKGIRSFGFSLFGGNADIDKNGFPDLAVGAYASDRAFILRSRPVAKVNARLRMSPRPIPLVATDLDCSKDGTQLCFNLDLNMKYNDIKGGLVDRRPIKVRYFLDADTLYKKKENNRSRIVFRDNGQSVLNGTFTIDVTKRETRKFKMDVLLSDTGKAEPSDPWTSVKIVGYYELVPTSEDFSTLDHILSRYHSSNFSEEGDFDKSCEDIEDCTSDLDLKVDLYLLGNGEQEKVNESTVLYVDDKDQLEMTMEVTNKLNVSYRTNLTVDVQAVLRRDVSQSGAVSAGCKYTLYKMPTNMYCTAERELDENEDMRVTSSYDISRAYLVPDTDTLENMQRFVNIFVNATQGNTDNDLSNNQFNISIPVMIKSEIDITVDKGTSDQVRYNADPESERGLRIRHIYYVTNNGPSFLPKTYVNISIPYKRDGETFAHVETGSLCEQRGKYVATTTPGTTLRTTTGVDYDIDKPIEYRKRREVEPATVTKTDTSGNEKAKTPTIRNITCEDYECVVFECKLVEMERSQTQTIDLSITVDEKEIARETGVREVRFITNASATPPTVWFSGKVVPWDGPEEEEKVTKFIVEPASVVTEVDIWIIIGSVLGALALLIIIMIILWKTGFFRRKKQMQLKKMRQESLYKRRSQMRPTSTMSTSKTNPPYNQIDPKEEL